MAQFVQEGQHLGVGRHPQPGLSQLLGGFQEQGLDPPWAKAAVQVKKRAVFGAGGVAAAVGLATFDEPFNQRGMEQRGRWGVNACRSLALRWRRASVEVWRRACILLVTIRGIPKPGGKASESEKALEIRKCLNPCKPVELCGFYQILAE